ncbi:hypothetical protein BTA51_04090 [Hahella sp. CCB-MM4]|uniref:hypothetical protein n=1 Tax=Hahella sp. (strain CCB-MM4) TaxID=1926491 RepID=UPI000B9B19BB|nr:hypothetical protein [Hahella sp. CCB-MM4]OZG74206.1 hypothetical protein BTA51_04090 [Hahella sp. CCB-MM4]
MTLHMTPRDPFRTTGEHPPQPSVDSEQLSDTRARGSIGNSLLMPLSCTGYVALTLPAGSAYQDTTWFLLFAALMFLIASIYAVASRQAFYPNTDLVMITTTGLLASLIALLGAWNHESLIPLLLLYLFWVYNLSGLTIQTAGFLSLMAIILGLGLSAMYHEDVTDIASDAVITLTANWMAMLTVQHNQQQLQQLLARLRRPAPKTRHMKVKYFIGEKHPEDRRTPKANRSP